MLYLKEANAEDIEKEYAFVREMPLDENGFGNEWHGCTRDVFVTQAIEKMLRFAKGENLPEDFVPETFLFLWDDDKIVGQFRVRHYLCESLRTGAGHIGYCVEKKYRGKGYGTEGLKLALDIARDIVPEEEFYLRLNKDNMASLRVMQKNGGYIVSEDEHNFYVRIKNPGKVHHYETRLCDFYPKNHIIGSATGDAFLIEIKDFY